MNPAAARQFWAERRWDDALSAFTQVLENSPEDVDLLADAARAFGHRHRFGHAHQLVARMLAVGGPALEARAGEVFRKLHRPALAAAHFASV